MSNTFQQLVSNIKACKLTTKYNRKSNKTFTVKLYLKLEVLNIIIRISQRHYIMTVEINILTKKIKEDISKWDW